MQHFKVLVKVDYNHIKTSITKLHTVCTYHEHGLERSVSLGRALDWWSQGCWFEPHLRWSHFVVSLSKTLNPLLSTGSNQEDICRHD